MENGKIETGYIAKWKTYPTNETKIRVCRPGPLGTPKELQEAAQSGKITWESFEIRYLTHIIMKDESLEALKNIARLVTAGQNVRLMCYEKEAPCHRFTLKRALDEFIAHADLPGGLEGRTQQ